MSRTKSVSVRLSEDEAARLHHLANFHGVTVSEVLRYYVRVVTDRPLVRIVMATSVNLKTEAGQ